MSSKSKLAYLNILLNVKQGVYETNKTQLQLDLLTLKKLLLLEVNNNNLQMQNLYNGLQRKLKKVAWFISSNLTIQKKRWNYGK